MRQRKLDRLIEIDARARWSLLRACCHAPCRPSQHEYHSTQNFPVPCCRAHAVVVRHR